MSLTTHSFRYLLMMGWLLVASVSGQNATNSTNSTLSPDPPDDPTLEPSVQPNATDLPQQVNATMNPTEVPNPSTGEPGSNTTSAPTEPPEKLACYDNTTVLREHLQFKNPFTPETYELCSNTVFAIGSVNEPGSLCCLDGQAPLHPRSNTKIQCGPDGKLENNCTIQGGNFQFLNVFTIFFEQPENAVMEGITFKDSLSSAALLVNGGSVTFRNCLFEGHDNDGTIVSFHSAPGLNPPDRRNLQWDDMTELSLEERVHWNVVEYSKLLKGEESAVGVFLDPAPTNEYVTDDEKDRDLQIGIIWELQQFVFENCTFQHNSQGDVGEMTKFGVVTVDLPYDIGTFENCTFYNNSHGNPEDARGYAINFAAGSKLTMINNCFIDNNFVGEGAVLLADAADLVESTGNYGTEKDDLVTCQYIHVGTEDDYECIEFESTDCLSGGGNNGSSSGTVWRSSFWGLAASLLAVVVALLSRV